MSGADAGDGHGPGSGPGDPPTVELERIVKEYREAETVRALDRVDLSVRGGEFLAVVGPSGSGKSTMLNLLGLLDAPTAGVVRLRGEDVTGLGERARTDARRRSIGFVFQDFHLLPTLTAVENVALPTAFDDRRLDRAAGLLERVGLGDRLDHTPDALSGGQKQRVAIARALINRPGLVLADEPTGNLDRGTGSRILSAVRDVCDRGVAVVAVTHDELVTDYADRTVRLVDGRLADGGGGFVT